MTRSPLADFLVFALSRGGKARFYIEKGDFDWRIMSAEILRDALRNHVNALAVDIGPRTTLNRDTLLRAANYIHSVFDQPASPVGEQDYQYHDQRVTNVLATVRQGPLPLHHAEGAVRFTTIYQAGAHRAVAWHAAEGGAGAAHCRSTPTVSEPRIRIRRRERHPQPQRGDDQTAAGVEQEEIEILNTDEIAAVRAKLIGRTPLAEMSS